MEQSTIWTSKQGDLRFQAEQYHGLTYINSVLANFEMQILPLFGAELLLKTLMSFQQQLVYSREALDQTQKLKSVTALLPYCSTNPPIPEHLRNVLSDVCHSIPGLAQAATTREGQEGLRQWLPETGEAEDIIGFWEQEFVVDWIARGGKKQLCGGCGQGDILANYIANNASIFILAKTCSS
jgi:hypothetical protein